jgi:hypothetical protein
VWKRSTRGRYVLDLAERLLLLPRCDFIFLAPFKQVSEHISAREPKPSLSAVSKAFYPDHDEWVAAVERTLSSFPEEDPDAERLGTAREGFGNVPLSKVSLDRSASHALVLETCNHIEK